MTTKETIKRLEEIITKKSPGECSYQKGVYGRLLHKSEDSVVQFAEVEPGALLENHVHNVLEMLVVVAGDLDVIYANDVVIQMRKGDIMRIPPCTAHSCSSFNGAKVIGILVPPNGGYPDVT
jgi:mannose-6-phosphate isomerase-like protein (cupin superfamily)